MKTQQELKKEILRLDGRGYPAYKDLKGAWNFKNFVLHIVHVQSDPFASPSDLTIEIPKPGYPRHLYNSYETRIALQDNLLRLFGQALRQADLKKSGSGKGGVMRVSRPGQQILERSAVTLDPKTGSLKLNLQVGFPAKGRSILAKALVRLLIDILPEIVEKNLIYANMTEKQQGMLQDGYLLARDQQEIRAQLKERNLAAFIADGSILPRQSGACDLPMEGARPFESFEENRILLNLPAHGPITGLGIPMGITLIAGGGYHGKSTLLNALEEGIYNHIRGDGREYVITREDAVKLRAEDGRAVHMEDISGFIRNLPFGKDTTAFSTQDASGSTSQAANTVEALETGSQLLLIDEDTSATNFMIRDDLMSEVVHEDQEPIIPFSSRIAQLKEDGVSTILVVGSSGSFFDQADLVIQMKEYEPFNITEKAKEAAKRHPSSQENEYEDLQKVPQRIPMKNERLLADRVKVKTTGLDTVSIAKEPIDVRAMEQLVDEEQLPAIGKMILYAQRNLVDGKKTNMEIAEELENLIRENGLKVLGKGSLAKVRKQEFLGALNRQRSQEFEIQNNTAEQ